MMLSKHTRYALHLLILLASVDRDEYHTTASLAERSEISLPTLRKLVESLSDSGLVETKMGPTGGVRLAHPPSEIYLLDYFRDRGELEHQSEGDECCVPLTVSECFIESILEQTLEPRLRDTTLQDLLTQPTVG